MLVKDRTIRYEDSFEDHSPIELLFYAVLDRALRDLSELNFVRRETLAWFRTTDVSFLPFAISYKDVLDNVYLKPSTLRLIQSRIDLLVPPPKPAGRTHRVTAYLKK